MTRKTPIFAIFCTYFAVKTLRILFKSGMIWVNKGMQGARNLS